MALCHPRDTPLAFLLGFGMVRFLRVTLLRLLLLSSCAGAARPRFTVDVQALLLEGGGSDTPLISVDAVTSRDGTALLWIGVFAAGFLPWVSGFGVLTGLLGIWRWWRSAAGSAYGSCRLLLAASRYETHCRSRSPLPLRPMIELSPGSCSRYSVLPASGACPVACTLTLRPFPTHACFALAMLRSLVPRASVARSLILVLEWLGWRVDRALLHFWPLYVGLLSLYRRAFRCAFPYVTAVERYRPVQESAIASFRSADPARCLLRTRLPGFWPWRRPCRSFAGPSTFFVGSCRFPVQSIDGGRSWGLRFPTVWSGTFRPPLFRPHPVLLGCLEQQPWSVALDVLHIRHCLLSLLSAGHCFFVSAVRSARVCWVFAASLGLEAISVIVVCGLTRHRKQFAFFLFVVASPGDSSLLHGHSDVAHSSRPAFCSRSYSVVVNSRFSIVHPCSSFFILSPPRLQLTCFFLSAVAL